EPRAPVDTARAASVLSRFAFRGSSSAGRAPRSQCGGQGFDPPLLHQEKYEAHRDGPGEPFRFECISRMLLTITTTHRPATDLGFLLHKNPSRPQSFELPLTRVRPGRGGRSAAPLGRIGCWR